MVGAIDRLDASSRADVYWAGRLTLCGSADDVVRYDRVFAAYFGDRPAALVRRPAAPAAQLRLVSVDADASPSAGDEPDDDASAVPATASRAELLRHRDIATLAGADPAVLARVPPAFALPRAHRGTPPTTPHPTRGP